MQESAEVTAIKEQYEATIRREAYRYQQRIDALVQQLDEERKRNALLEAELVQYLRNQSPALRGDGAGPVASVNSSPLELKLVSKTVTANIIDAREMKEKDGGRKYTAFVVNMSNERNDSWTIYKRYSQFEVLHWLLVRRFADEVPEFPPKREFISKAVKIPKRKAGLQQYCNELLTNPKYSTFGAVVEFFKPEKTEKEFVSSPKAH